VETTVSTRSGRIGSVQAQPDHLADATRPAGGGAQHGARFDVAARGADLGDPVAAGVEAGHLGEGMDLDPAPVGAAPVSPDHRVVAEDRPARVEQRAHHRPGDVVRGVQRRDPAAHLVEPDHAAVDAELLVHGGALGRRRQRPFGVGEAEHAALGQHDVEVELGAEVVVEVERGLVEARPLRGPVVRPHDRRVAPRAAGADVALLQHRDVGDAVVLGQVVGGRQALHAAADDDDVVALLQRQAGAPHAPGTKQVLHPRIRSPSGS